MKSQELSRQLERIESLFQRAQDACGDNVEMLSHWAKYLCVLAAGFLENALQDTYSRFVRQSSSEAVQNYATSQLAKILNPKTGRFLEIAGAFKKSWSEDLKVFVDDSGRREAIDSIMQNRHQIAHGQSSDVTLVRVRDYLAKSVQVIEFIESQCGL
jgi:hypothetical protein